MTTHSVYDSIGNKGVERKRRKKKKERRKKKERKKNKMKHYVTTLIKSNERIPDKAAQFQARLGILSIYYHHTEDTPTTV